MTRKAGVKVVVNLEVEGIHCWPECPFDDVSFLKNPHRHIFKIRVTKTVDHNDRDVEIILLKRKIHKIIVSSFPSEDSAVQFGRMSCEDIAEFILNNVNVDMVEVLEDGENGGLVWSR